MNDLPKLIELFVELSLGASKAFLTGVDGLGEQGAALLEGLRVSALLEIHTLGFKKALQILEQFVFF